MRVALVLGGAGFVGSHMVRLMQQRGWQPVILDNLTSGNAASVAGADLVCGDLGDRALLDSVFSRYRIEAVVHLAGCSRESGAVANPADYYRKNVLQTLPLLEAMSEHHVGGLLLCSAAAVYGYPVNLPIRESQALSPVCTYGRTMLALEGMVKDFASASALKYVSLRCFNVAGSDASSVRGGRFDPEAHLIPWVLQVANGQSRAVTVFGRDYPTPDGTYVRDYVHVQDVCAALMLALQRLLNGDQNRVYNIGNGRGHSVDEVITAVRRVTGRKVPVVEGDRRSGTPAVLLADSSLAREELGWLPRFPALETMVAHAWNWNVCESPMGAVSIPEASGLLMTGGPA